MLCKLLFLEGKDILFFELAKPVSALVPRVRGIGLEVLWCWNLFAMEARWRKCTKRVWVTLLYLYVFLALVSGLDPEPFGM